MEITLRYFFGCPNWETTAHHLDRLIREGVDATVGFELIDTEEDALARGFRGSPTVLIDGIDPFAEEEAAVGLSCRTYRTQNELAGSPSLAQLREAVQAARDRSNRETGIDGA